MCVDTSHGVLIMDPSDSYAGLEEDGKIIIWKYAPQIDPSGFCVSDSSMDLAVKARCCVAGLAPSLQLCIMEDTFPLLIVH